MIPTIGALFAGGGLADLGAEQAGCPPVMRMIAQNVLLALGERAA